MRFAEAGIVELQKCVDTQIIIPNQNLFRVANEKTTFADAFAMADQVLYSGVACITDLMVKEGLINLDFADVRAVMREMGKAMMGTGEASGEKRALRSAEAAIANPLIDDVSMKGARGLLISITGGKDLTLYEVDEAATRIREEVDQDANIIVGATFDEGLEGIIRVSVVATGIDHVAHRARPPAESRIAELDAASCASTPSASPPSASSASSRSRAPRRAAPQAAAARRSSRPRPRRWPPRLLAGATRRRDRSARSRRSRRCSWSRCMAEPAPQEMPKAFIPPQPERAGRGPRMPRIDELPMPAQNEIRAQRGELAETGPEKQRMSLLQRLAQVGLGRRDDSEAHGAAAPRRRAAHAIAAAAARASRSGCRIRCRNTPSGRPAPAPQGLDIHGRQALPVHKPVDDDQLEIPAFLRRQAN